VEIVADRCGRAERFLVGPEYKMPSNLECGALARVRPLADHCYPRRDLELQIDVGEHNRKRVDDLNVPLHRQILADNSVHEPNSGKFRVLERMWLRITRIRRRRRRRLRSIVDRGLRKNRLDVGAGLAVLLEPSIDLALSGVTLSRRSAI